jgi:hypothetical protein
MEDAEYRKRPAKIFRYFPPDASDIFSTRKLWFSAAKDFNDIFEVLPRYDSLISSEIEANIKKQYAFLPPNISVSWQKYKKFMQAHTSQIYSDSLEVIPLGFQNKFSEHFGIVCFSENPDSLLMWGHYTNSHQGFVVEFDPNHSFFAPEDFGKILYSTDRPIAEASQNWKSWKMLLTKSAEWRYESEYRLIKQLKTLNRAKRRDGNEKYCIDLPPDAVRAVYFGCKILQKAQAEILTDLKADGWKHISKFAMRRHDSQYAIQPLPFEKLRHPPEDARKDFDNLWQIMGIK